MLGDFHGDFGGSSRPIFLGIGALQEEDEERITVDLFLVRRAVRGVSGSRHTIDGTTASLLLERLRTFQQRLIPLRRELLVPAAVIVHRLPGHVGQLASGAHNARIPERLQEDRLPVPFFWCTTCTSHSLKLRHAQLTRKCCVALFRQATIFWVLVRAKVAAGATAGLRAESLHQS